jgi:carboxyl-terminal processing protease
LVQTIRPLSYNANLKITTAKYYIPSGRCVQSLDYGRRNGDGTPERNENGGIVPDSVVSLPMYSRIAMELVARDYLHEYSLRYFTRNRTIPQAGMFYISDEEYADFVKETSGKEFDDRSATEILLESFSRTAKAEGYEELLEKEIQALQERLHADKATDLMHYRKEIQPLLEEEICSRYYLQEGRLRSMIRDDLQLEKAMSILKTNQ